MYKNVSVLSGKGRGRRPPRSRHPVFQINCAKRLCQPHHAQSPPWMGYHCSGSNWMTAYGNCTWSCSYRQQITLSQIHTHTIHRGAKSVPVFIYIRVVPWPMFGSTKGYPHHSFILNVFPQDLYTKICHASFNITSVSFIHCVRQYIVNAIEKVSIRNLIKPCQLPALFVAKSW